MIARRDLIIGASCLLGAGAAYAMTPRRRISLLARGQLKGLVPQSFGEWRSREVGDLVAPKEEDSLAAKLYQETVERVYQHSSNGAEVMMLLAHGDTQSNELQLHRPEVCYPAFGYEVIRSAPMELKIAKGVTLPSRKMTAQAPGRREHIVYWSRLGEFLPVNGSEQRFDRLKTAIDGDVFDGVLARFSSLGADAGLVLGMLETFIPAFLQAVPADKRLGLIGTARAKSMAAAGA